jgi:hypothetical protein
MRRYAVVSCGFAAITLLACSKSEQTTTKADSGMPVPMAPKSVSATDFAGTWTIKTMNEKGDSVLVTSELVATADTMPWMLHLPNRPPIQVKILSMGGDSVVAEAGPYESVLRKGVKVTTHFVYHLQDGMLKGTIIGHYAGVKTADSVRTMPIEGTKKP